MKKMIKMRSTIDFGKINYFGTGKRYPADVTVELRVCGGEEIFTADGTHTGKHTPEYVEFTASGYIWNTKKTDIYCGGQCLDTMFEFLKGNADFRKVYGWWKAYHLNGMHAGTPEQEQAIAAWKAKGNMYDYTAACDYLKGIGLYEVEYTGKSTGRMYDNEPYRYGSAWLIQDIPEDVVREMEEFIQKGE